MQDHREERIFKDLRAFYQADETRWRSPEAQYGSQWRLDGWAGTWEVAYVRDTGEVYAHRLNTGGPFSGPLMVLGTFPPDPGADPADVYYRGLERYLEGWTNHCGPRNGLAWLMERMAQAP